MGRLKVCLTVVRNNIVSWICGLFSLRNSRPNLSAAPGITARLGSAIAPEMLPLVARNGEAINRRAAIAKADNDFPNERFPSRVPPPAPDYRAGYRAMRSAPSSRRESANLQIVFSHERSPQWLRSKASVKVAHHINSSLLAG